MIFSSTVDFLITYTVGSHSIPIRFEIYTIAKFSHGDVVKYYADEVIM